MIQKAESTLKDVKDCNNNLSLNTDLSGNNGVKYKKDEYTKEVNTANKKLLSNLEKTGYRVVVDDDKFNYISNKVASSEEDLNNKFNFVLDKLDLLCKEKFVIPKTTKKVENILKKTKELLPEMNNISAEIKEKITKYLSGIDDIDNT